MTRLTRTRTRVVRIVAAITALTFVVSACSGDGEDAPDADSPAPSESVEAAVEVVTDSTIGAVAGRLGPDKQEVIREEVTAVVEDYTDWAYLAGDYPRTEWDFPVPHLTPRASRRVERDLLLATNADIGATIDSVTPVSRTVTVDVLSPKGEPAGATGRFEVTFATEGDAGEQEVTVKGRLVLVPDPAGWVVVGHYFSKGAS